MSKLLPTNFVFEGQNYGMIERKNRFVLFLLRSNSKRQGYVIYKTTLLALNGIPSQTEIENAIETLPTLPVQGVNQWFARGRSEALALFKSLWIVEARSQRMARKKNVDFINAAAGKKNEPEIKPIKTKAAVPAVLLNQDNSVGHQIDMVNEEFAKRKMETARRNRLLRKGLAEPLDVNIENKGAGF